LNILNGLDVPFGGMLRPDPLFFRHHEALSGANVAAARLCESSNFDHVSFFRVVRASHKAHPSSLFELGAPPDGYALTCRRGMRRTQRQRQRQS